MRHLWIDFSAADFGEFDGKQIQGSSTLVQFDDSLLSPRSLRAARCSTPNAGEIAYAERSGLAIAIAPGQTLVMGMRMRPVHNSIQSSNRLLGAVTVSTGSHYYFRLDSRVDGTVVAAARASGSYAETLPAPLTLGTIYHVAIRVRRATASGVADGAIALYIDGALASEVATVNNYDDAVNLSSLRVGAAADAKAGLIWEFAELVVADTVEETITRPHRRVMHYPGIGEHKMADITRSLNDRRTR